jgi:hypothetical protein
MAKAKSKSGQGTRSLKDYAVVAGAAMALPVAGHAAPVFTPVSQTLFGLTTGNVLGLDVNGDSILDLYFYARADDLSSIFAKNNVSALTGATYLVDSAGNPANVPAGGMVGPAGTFSTAVGGVLSKEFFTGANFPIDGTTNGFLGFSVDPGGGAHYGFLQLTTLLGNSKNFGKDEIIITGIGYESTAGTAIATPNASAGSGVPEPGSLGLFALGAAGLEMLRRWRAQSAKRNGSA